MHCTRLLQRILRLWHRSDRMVQSGPSLLWMFVQLPAYSLVRSDHRFMALS